MTIVNFQNTLEFDFGITFKNRIKHLNGQPIFFNKIIMKLRLAIENNKFIKLSQKKFQDFLRFEHKEILAESEASCLYRIAGKLYLNRLVNGTWETARIY